MGWDVCRMRRNTSPRRGGDCAIISYEGLTALVNILRYEPGKVKQDIEALKKIIGK
ncbi:hypothetical protein [Anaerovibrio sp.]|uniref:hypothetical protein n=1 Tax=Anaerovibrio sp. TaxID=1872532 RepID=UPI0025C0B353|nr:hypothetical protein [Anaerovibrio sp.]